MGEEPRDEPIDVSIKPPVDVTLRAVDPSAQGAPEGPTPAPDVGGQPEPDVRIRVTPETPAQELVAEDPVAKATREARESQDGQQEPDVRLGGSPDSPGGELMEEDPVARATREARESQEGQQEAEPEDIGAVALTPHQLELQKHEDDPEHSRGDKDLAYYEHHAQAATDQLIENLENMDLDPKQKESLIAELKSSKELAATTAREKYLKEKAIADEILQDSLTKVQKLVTEDRTDSHLLGARMRDVDDGYFVGKKDEDSRNVTISGSTIVTLVNRIAKSVGADASKVFESGNIPSESELDHNSAHKIILPTSFDGYILEISRDYMRQTVSKLELKDLPRGISIGLRKGSVPSSHEQSVDTAPEPSGDDNASPFRMPELEPAPSA